MYQPMSVSPIRRKSMFDDWVILMLVHGVQIALKGEEDECSKTREVRILAR